MLHTTRVLDTRAAPHRFGIDMAAAQCANRVRIARPGAYAGAAGGCTQRDASARVDAALVDEDDGMPELDRDEFGQPLRAAKPALRLAQRACASRWAARVKMTVALQKSACARVMQRWFELAQQEQRRRERERRGNRI